MSATDNSTIMANQLSDNKASQGEVIGDVQKALANAPTPQSKTMFNSLLSANSNPYATQDENVFTNPFYLSVFLVGLIVVITLMIYLGGPSVNPETGEQQKMSIVWKLLLGAVIVALLMYVTQYMLFYYFNIDITAQVKNLFTKDEPQIDIAINQDTSDKKPEPEPKPEPKPDPEPSGGSKEVFNISDNVYTYDDAKLVCKAYDADLATYDQIENSYRKGGEWCNYGWSANQLALFPTQKLTYSELQKHKGHEHDCGRPGINGGFIANKNVRFGVNCYGVKPEITPEEEEQMKNTTPYPKTKQDIAMDMKLKRWKNKLSEIMVSPFNYETWSVSGSGGSK